MYTPARKTVYIVLICAALCLLCACGGAGTVPMESRAPVHDPTPAPTVRLPHITLNDAPEIDWPFGIPYADAGFTAVDADGVDITAAVVCAGAVDCMTLGDYDLSYTVCAEGETAEAHRMVHVASVGYPATVEAEDKVIYLTFDDGPCANTPLLLDILDRYDAKATFFVIGGENPYFDALVPQIHAAGHSIGVHAKDHRYEILYRSAQTYLDDLMAVRRQIYDLTGEYVSQCRFPGGSTTAYYMLYNREKGAWTAVMQQLECLGIQYFDWNIKPENSTNNAGDSVMMVKKYTSKYAVPVSLQHDTRFYSVAAVEKILEWGTENGYSFRGLDVTVPPVHDRLPA